MASEGKNLIGVDIGTTAIKVCEVREDPIGSFIVSPSAT